jgi:hypothetical protein
VIGPSQRHGVESRSNQSGRVLKGQGVSTVQPSVEIIGKTGINGFQQHSQILSNKASTHRSVRHPESPKLFRQRTVPLPKAHIQTERRGSPESVVADLAVS